MTFYILDVFANSRYSGNQLAVFADIGDLSSHEMQQIATEIGFSETAFLISGAQNRGGYPVRIFTPCKEVAFAGHPSLGTAYILNKYIDREQKGSITLNLKAGQIPVDFSGDILWMKQNQPEFGKTMDAGMLAGVLGLHSRDIDAGFPVQEVTTGLPFTIVPLSSKAALQAAKINAEQYLEFVNHTWAKGILVFCQGGYDHHQELSQRVFVDYLGIPEDPATGSGTGCMAAYLVRHKLLGSNKVSLSVGQGYEIGRPSELMIKASEINNYYDIMVGGKVVEIATGEWYNK